MSFVDAAQPISCCPVSAYSTGPRRPMMAVIYIGSASRSFVLLSLLLVVFFSVFLFCIVLLRSEPIQGDAV